MMINYSLAPPQWCDIKDKSQKKKQQKNISILWNISDKTAAFRHQCRIPASESRTTAEGESGDRNRRGFDKIRAKLSSTVINGGATPPSRVSRSRGVFLRIMVLGISSCQGWGTGSVPKSLVQSLGPWTRLWNQTNVTVEDISAVNYRLKLSHSRVTGVCSSTVIQAYTHTRPAHIFTHIYLYIYTHMCM